MSTRKIVGLALLAVAILGVLAFLVSLYLQPILSVSANTALFVAVSAFVGAALFLGAVNEASELFERLFSQRRRIANPDAATGNNNAPTVARGEQGQPQSGVATVNPASPKSRVFISYARTDRSQAEKLHQDLKNAGFQTWLDTQNLLPGQDWELEIRKAIRAADFFVVCLSTASVGRRGFIHKELKIALDILDQMPEGDIYLIAVRLDACQVPERIMSRQWVDLFEPNGLQKLVAALRAP